MNKNKETKTMNRAAYNEQNEGKTVLTHSIPYNSIKEMIELMENDTEPTFEFTATDKNTLEEYLISLELTKEN